MPGGHSLEAWGERFKMPKGDFKDFSRYSEEMLVYCIRDVAITLRLFTALTGRMLKRGFSEKSCQLEHEIRVVIDKQKHNGFYFDIPRATSLQADLRQQGRDLEGPIRELFPAELVVSKTLRYRELLSGGLPQSIRRNMEVFPKWEIRGDEIDFYEYREFNIASPKQRVERLLGLGWVPTKFTPKTDKGGGGNPQVDETELLAFAESSGKKEIEAIAKWLVLNGRANMIGTWLDNVDYDDSRMHGTVFSCGAGTRRMTHSSPNTANIPKADPKVPYGAECRALWTVADVSRRCLVGYDAKGLEMRMFAHYLGNRDAAELYINGDPHQVNADLLGITRSVVKNVFYAFLYGAQDPKLGATGGHDKAWGRDARAKLRKGTPGLDRLVREIQAEYEDGGWLRCIDGGFVRCPSPHAALNYKLQSAGGIVMKQASIFIDREVERRGLDSKKVGDIHDEGQHDVDRRCAQEFGELAVQAIRNAGEELRFNVPLDGDFKIGNSWADTH